MRRERALRRWLGAFACLGGCADPGTATSGASAQTATSSAAPRGTASAPPSATSSSRALHPQLATWKTGVGPRIEALGLPDGPRPALRADLVFGALGALGALGSGRGVAARLFLAHVTKEDGVTLALRFTGAEGPLEDGKPAPSRGWVDWGAALVTLEVSVELPSGERVILNAQQPAGAATIPGDADSVQVLRVTAGGLDWIRGATDPWSSHLAAVVRLAWKRADPRLFASTGRHRLGIAGTVLVGGQPLALRLGDLEFEVVAKSESFRPTEALVARATKELTTLLRQKPTSGAPGRPLRLEPYAPAVEDVAGSVWLRYQLEGASLDAKGVGYDETLVVDAVVDRSGKLLSAAGFKHFACVAEGTPIATPAGATPVERLRVREKVLAFDLEAGQRVVTRVERVARVAAPRELYALGRLRVTGEHPVFAGGAFRRADSVAAGAELMGLFGEALGGPARATGQVGVVYELAVGPPHDYFAAGFLVHNKAIGFVVGGGAPWRGLFERPTD